MGFRNTTVLVYDDNFNVKASMLLKNVASSVAFTNNSLAIVSAEE